MPTHEPSETTPPSLPNEGGERQVWERALLSRIRDGDRYAFALLVEEYLDIATRSAVGIVHAIDVAEDIVQSVFIWLWQARESLEPQIALRPYLLRAVRNRALNEQKAERTRARYRAEHLGEATAAGTSHSTSSPEQLVLLSDEIQFGLRQLPERRQSAIRLRFEMGLSYAEIGEIMGISPKAATQLVLRGLHELRNLLSV